MEEMLNISGATVCVGGHTLFRTLDLRVRRGEWVCLAGPSGCGKTSLLRAVMGFAPLSQGSLTVAGHTLAPHTLPQIRRQMAYMPQDLVLPALGVRELLQLPFSLKSLGRRSFPHDHILRLWQQLDLSEELLDLQVSQLSGGQRRRVLLSVAVATQRPLVLADEPASALDEEGARRVAAVLRDVARQGRAVLSVTHSSVLLQQADRTITIPEPPSLYTRMP